MSSQCQCKNVLVDLSYDCVDTQLRGILDSLSSLF